MADLENESLTGGIEYEYSPEILDAYRRSSTEWKLNWLEEVNVLTFQVLDERHRALREKIRRGEI